MTNTPDSLANQQRQATENYLGYLSNAAVVFEDAISRLKDGCADNVHLFDATSMAHKIKGNALMYGYPTLGEQAKALEAILKLPCTDDMQAGAIDALIKLIDAIHEICSATDRSEPDWLRDGSTVRNLAGDDYSPAPPVIPDRKSILIVYQDAWVSNLLASMLEPEYQVHQCHTVEAAIIQCDIVLPDIVVTEKTLSDYSGFRIIEYLKTLTDITDLPTIMVTHEGHQADIARALSLGVTDYFENVFDIIPVALRVKEILHKEKQSVLIVDDDSAVRDLLRHRFEIDGIHVETANDGVVALKYLATHTPDLVILDRMMPRLEGTAVLYEIKNKINLKSIPVMILTAMSNRNEASEWFKRGAVDFIAKPFNPDEVLMRARKYLED